MISEPEKTTAETSKTQTRFYLLFDALGKATASAPVSAASLDEMDEIEQVRRMVMDVSDDRPIFMTST